MNCLRFAAVVTSLAACFAVAQEKAQPAMVKVEIHLAVEHAPKELKAGDRVDLKYVLSSTRAKSGKALHRTGNVVTDVVVDRVEHEKKPKDPAMPILVELKVTKAQADRIEKFKTELVTVVESSPGGKVETKKRPVPFRLELVKQDKK